MIGLDFDNTIVSYDRVFHDAALERGLIPDSVPAVKEDVRDYLRSVGQEDDWTELQGAVYGPLMNRATLFDGVIEFLQACRDREVNVCIVSHRTRYPYRGPQHDLHQAGYEWIAAQGIHERGGVPRAQVFFELTKQAKLERIAATGCSHFVDDLVELLGEPGFPPNVERILFDPSGNHEHDSPFPRVSKWHELGALL